MREKILWNLKKSLQNISRIAISVKPEILPSKCVFFKYILVKNKFPCFYAIYSVFFYGKWYFKMKRIKFSSS